MKRSTTRILTTHTGSLARPRDLLEMMKARAEGQTVNQDEFGNRAKAAVAAVVRQQAESGIDVVTDGEQSKAGFFVYANDRLTGLEPSQAGPDYRRAFKAEMDAFPEYYEQYFGSNMRSVAGVKPLVCSGPITYKGQAAVQADVENLKAALQNVHYKSDEEYLFAVGEAMREEYQAIVGAGFIVQIDDPWLAEFYNDDPSSRPLPPETHVEAINHAIRGIPPEKVRFHTCYGINEGPRVHDAALKDYVELMLRINAGAYSFE